MSLTAIPRLARTDERDDLIGRALAQKAEILGYFRRMIAVNAALEAQGRRPIDPDPDGEMRYALEHCNRVLMGEMFG
jgi:hypothetical protein